jgi:threonine/homoserine/homoserine lactone efflux protein
MEKNNFPFQTGQLVQQVAVKSAVNPSLWACAVISLPLFILSSKSQSIYFLMYFFIAIIPILAFVVSYIYLLFKNPEYLRSEAYQLRMNSMRLLGDRDNPLNANAKDIVAVINNPALPEPEKQE